jgi:hypothetical protein
VKMPRLQGLELEDLSFCPQWLRDEATEILVRGLDLVGWPGAIARLWQPWLAALGNPPVVDCCSGASGPLAGILREFPLRVTVTDRYPNLKAWEQLSQRFPGWVDYDPCPVDARCLPPEHRGVWSFFNSFHHLAPADATRVLREAVFRSQPIAVFEALERDWSRLPLVLSMPLLSLTSVFWARPFRWSRLNPLIAFLLTWDGLMSCFRAYSDKDWREMIFLADPDERFEWEIGRIRLGWLPVYAPYLLGRPRRGGSMFVSPAGEA